MGNITLSDNNSLDNHGLMSDNRKFRNSNLELFIWTFQFKSVG